MVRFWIQNPLYSIASQRVLDRFDCIYTPELKKKAMGGSSTRSAQLVIDEYALPLTASEYLARRQIHLLELFADTDEIDAAGPVRYRDQTGRCPPGISHQFLMQPNAT